MFFLPKFGLHESLSCFMMSGNFPLILEVAKTVLKTVVMTPKEVEEYVYHSVALQQSHLRQWKWILHF